MTPPPVPNPADGRHHTGIDAADLTQIDVQRMILHGDARYQQAVEHLGELAEQAARHEASYRVALKRAFLTSDGPVAVREAHALVACEQQLLDRELSAARLKAQYEVLEHLKAQLGALRTLAADFRANTT